MAGERTGLAAAVAASEEQDAAMAAVLAAVRKEGEARRREVVAVDRGAEEQLATKVVELEKERVGHQREVRRLEVLLAEGRKEVGEAKEGEEVTRLATTTATDHQPTSPPAGSPRSNLSSSLIHDMSVDDRVLEEVLVASPRPPAVLYNFRPINKSCFQTLRYCTMSGVPRDSGDGQALGTGGLDITAANHVNLAR